MYAIYLLTLISCIYCQIDFEKLMLELEKEFLSIVIEHSNPDIINKYVIQDQVCGNAFFRMHLNKTMMDDMYTYSGKGFNDLGNEKSCSNNYFYLLLRFKIDIEIYYDSQKNDIDLYRFFDNDNFFIGLCVLKECQVFYKNFLDVKQNDEFYDFLSRNGILKIEMIESRFDNDYKSHMYIYVIWTILCFIILKVIFSLIGWNIFNKEDNLYVRDSKSSGSSFEDSQSLSEGNTNKINKINTTNQKKFFYKLYKIMSLSTGFKNLYTVKTKIYNDKGLESIGFIRAIIIFMTTLNHNIFSLFVIPHKDFSTYEFLKHPLFFIAKFSSLSIVIWIMLDGIEMVYKLMCYIKKSNDTSFMRFLKFYSNSIYRMLVFYLIFYLFYYNFDDLGILVGKTTTFDEFYSRTFNRQCINNLYTLFIPFYIQYIQSAACFRHVFLYVNEMISFTIVLFIFYLCFKLKSKVIELIVVLSLVVIPLTNSYDLNPIRYLWKNYNKSIFFGNYYDVQHTHCFYFFYMLGTLTGLVYFYYQDVVSQDSMETNYDYIPFYFTFYIMRLLDSLKRYTKYIIYFLSLFVLFLISNNFLIFKYIFSDNYELSFKLNNFIYFTFIYEKYVFAIFAFLSIITFIMYPSIGKSNRLDLNIFIPFNRISFCYFNLLNSLVYLFYAVYSIQVYLNYQTIIILTIGLVGLLFLLSSIIFIIFEVPIKITIKIIKNKLYS